MGYFITHRSVGRPSMDPHSTIATATLPRSPKKNLEPVRLMIGQLKELMRTENDPTSRASIAQAGLALNNLLLTGKS